MPDYDNRPGERGPNDGTTMFVIALILCLLLGGGYYYYTVNVKHRERELLQMRMEAEAAMQEAMQAQSQAEADLRQAVEAGQQSGQQTPAPDGPNEPTADGTEGSVESENNDSPPDE